MWFTVTRASEPEKTVVPTYTCFSSSVSAKPLMPVIKARFIVLNSQTDTSPENQFGVTTQSPPAALRRPHKALASSRLASGPTRTR
jgi:dihydrofolate reductase